MTATQNPELAIHVQGLWKSYKELEVLRGVDLDVERGRIFALLGSNGSGKTTIVKILSTLSEIKEVALYYRGALSRIDHGLGVSVLDCVTELSRLALLPTPPATTARLSRAAVERLSTNRSRAAEALAAYGGR